MRTFVRWDNGTLPDGFAHLRETAEAEGYDYLTRMEREISAGEAPFASERAALFFVYDEGELIGIGGVRPDHYDPSPDLLRIRHVYVLPEHRKAGHGDALAAVLIQQGFESAPRLCLRAADARAAAFWERHGFQKHETTGHSHLLTR